MTLDALNERFGIGEQLVFKAGAGSLPVAEIDNGYGRASIAVHGGHVVAYQPHGQAGVLWLSTQSRFEPGKAIRGGIPVCWPWFGDHPTDPARPAHGFVRTGMWRVVESAAFENGATSLRLGIADDEHSRALWPHAFNLYLDVTLGAGLQVTLTAINPGPEAFTITAALHSYFAVDDIARVKIAGLEGCAYLDKVDGMRRKVQHGPIVFSGETDRIYVDTAAACCIEDPLRARRIRITKSGSHSTVVWNPWSEKAARMSDFGDGEYTGMVCVETANAADDAVTIPPGGEHRLRAEIAVEAIA